MARTTVDIDDPVLREVRRLQKREGKTLGQAVSELLADALARRRETPAPPPAFAWTKRDMQARVDVDDKDALWLALDEDGGGA